MDELDKLKQDWKKNEGNFPKFSEKEIYAMLHKKSSSIVKWILIISILEFVFWVGLSFLMKDSQSNKQLESFHVDYVTIPMTVLGYAIIIYFFCRFYINYRKITATDNVKKLMDTILRTRKTVSHYIIANLAYIILSCIMIFTVFFQRDKALIDTLHKYEANGNEMMFYLIYIALAIVFIGIFVLVVWLFYKLIYGLLLRRLRRNYEELKKIDF
jgi:NADH:ubiquinone oxidoreductase subunit 5 (subunit L)/multisubunit Na+/H+ antiporter MnhA subunit